MAGMFDDVFENKITPKEEPAPVNTAGLDSLIGDDTKKIAAAHSDSQDIKPDVAKRRLKAMAASGLPEDYVSTNLDAVEKEVYKSGFDPEEYQKSNPIFSSWLAKNKNHYPLVKNDIGFFSKAENAYKSMAKGWQSIAPQEEVGSLLFKELDSGLTPAESLRLKAARESLKTFQPKEGEESGLDYFARQAGQASSQLVSTAIEGGKGAVYGAPVGAIAGSVIPGVGTVAGWGAGLTAGGATALYQYTYKLEAGFAYDELRDITGVDEDTKKIVAKGVGSVNGVIELVSDAALLAMSPLAKGAIDKVGGKFSKDFVKSSVKQALRNPTTAGALVSASKKIVGGAAIEGMEEFIQAMVNVGGEATLKATSTEPQTPINYSEKTVDAAKQMLDAFVGTLFTGGILTGLPDYYRSTKEIRKAKETKIFLDALAQGGESESKKQLPEKHQEAISFLTKDGPLSSVYIPIEKWNEYFQSKQLDPSEVAAEVSGDGGASYKEASENGIDLKIDTGKYAEKIAQNEHGKALNSEVRHSPSAMSESEETQLLEALSSDQEKPDVKSKMADEQSEKIQAEVYDKLIATGKFTPKQARANSKLYDGLRVMGLRAGMTPEQISEKFPISIVAGETQGGNELFQTNTESPEFKAFIGNTKVVDESGKPKVVYHGTSDKFDTFDYSKALKDGTQLGRGFYFTDQKETAKGYAGNTPDSNVIESHIRIENPASTTERTITKSQVQKLIKTALKSDKEAISNWGDRTSEPQSNILKRALDVYEKEENDVDLLNVIGHDIYGSNWERFFKDVKKVTGHDGVIEKQKDGSTHYVPFLSEQIKSVNNSGTYDPNNPNIFYQSQPNAPAFYSKLTRTVEEKMGGSASPEQIMGMLREVKPEEMQWMGVEDFLKGKKKVSKQEMLDFLAGNQVEIREVVKGKRDTIYVQGDDSNPAGKELSVEEFSLYEYGKKYSDLPANEKEFVDSLVGPREAGYGKFSQYTVPGGENYSEILFTLPSEPKASKTPGQIAKEYFGKDSIYDLEPSQQREVMDQYQELVKQGYENLKKEFTSSHFSEPNVLAHARVNERTDLDGKRILFVEEIQSDWHQKGRKSGYKEESKISKDELKVIHKTLYDKRLDITEAHEKDDYLWKDVRSHIEEYHPHDENLNDQQVVSLYAEIAIHSGKDSPAPQQERAIERIGKEAYDKLTSDKELNSLLKKFRDNLDEMERIRKEIRELESKLPQGDNAVPNAPFKKTWQEFVLKRLIREAAEKGFDKIAWTTGETQAERYDLSKQIDRIGYRKDGDNTFEFAAIKDGDTVVTKSFQTIKEVEDNLGKDIADKILKGEGKDRDGNGNVKDLSGVDLKVGGEGMKGFYDKILVDAANKLGKKFGAKVGKSEVEYKTSDKPTYKGPQLTPDELRAVAGKQDSIMVSSELRTAAAHLERFDSNADEFSMMSYRDHYGFVMSDLLSIKSAKLIGGDLTLGNEKQTVHSLPITPELKAAALTEGFPLFQGEGIKQGSYSSLNGEHLIKLFKDANLSTFLHETAHFYLEVMKSLSGIETASQSLKDDYATIMKYVGNKGEPLTVDQHEKFAKTFEKYLMTGEAPSEGLRKAFGSFKSWLSMIYRKTKEVYFGEVELNKEITDVLDRMLATEEEIAQAKIAQPIGLTREALDKLGLDDIQKRKHAELVSEIEELAKSKMLSVLLKEQEREKKSAWMSERDAIVERLVSEKKDTPVYQAMEAIKNGLDENGAEITVETKLDSATLKDLLGEEEFSKLPKWLHKKNGVDPELISERYGFSSAGQMVSELSSAGTLLQNATEEADTLMKEKYGEVFTDQEAMSEEAASALLNEKREDLERMELEMLMTGNLPIFRNGKRVKTRREVEVKFLKGKAELAIAGKRLKDIEPILFKRAAKKAYDASIKAALAGDKQAAMDAKLKEVYNNYLFQFSKEAKDATEKKVRKIRDLGEDKVRGKVGKAGADYLAQFDYFLDKFEFDYVPKKRLDAIEQSFAEFVSEKQENGESMGEEVLYPSFMNEAVKTNYRELTLDEFNGLYDALMQIKKMATSINTFRQEGIKETRESMKEKMIAQIMASAKDKSTLPPATEHGATVIEKFGLTASKMDAALIKPETILDWLDNNNKSGLFNSLLFNTAADAENARNDMDKEVQGKLAEAVKKIPKETKKKMLETVVGFPDAKYRYVRRDLIGIVLNLGNDSNKDKIMAGNGYSDEQIRFVLDTLTKEELDFVQSVWDVFEDMYPKVTALQRELTGLPLEKIAVTPLVTKHGTYRGGYYPMMYTKRGSATGEVQVSNEAGNLLSVVNRKAATFSGYRQSRVAGYSAEVEINFDRLQGHLSMVTQDLNFRRWLIDANWFISNQEIRKAMNDSIGEAYTARLSEWVKQVVNDRNNTSLASLSTFNKFIVIGRYNTAIAVMGFKATTMISQFSGLSAGAEKIGSKWALLGLSSMATRPMSTYKFVTSKSGQMKHRFDTLNNDIREYRNFISGKSGPFKQIANFAMYGVGLSDSLVSAAVWTGAYKKALSEGKSDQAAVYEADSAVRLSQGSGSMKDLSSVMATQDPFWRATTMFYTPFSALYSRLRDVGHEFGSIKDVPMAAYRIFLLTTLPAIMGEILSNRGPDDWEDEDEVMKWMLKTNASYAVSSIPLLRDAVNSSLVLGEFGYNMSPLEGTVRTIFKPVATAQKVIDGEADVEKLYLELFQSAGYVLPFPSGQLTITGDYLLDLYNGEENADNLWTFSRDVLFKRKKD